jgi:ribosomal protein L7Ae-like RNA K-turn-binding protein
MAQLMTAVHRATNDGVSQAAAAGALVGGHAKLVKSRDLGTVDMVIVASDASERTVRSLQTHADEEVVFVSVPVTTEQLGQRVGRGSRAALGVTASRAASHLRRQLHRLVALG